MPLTNYDCVECGRVIHTDDQLEGECLNCGEELEERAKW